MNRKAYSKIYYKWKASSREAMREAVKRFQEQNPKRFAELQTQAQRELNEPPKPRIVTRHPLPDVDVDVLIRRNHTKDYLIHTTDCWSDTHLYFEGLNNENAEDVLIRRHPKFSERDEKVTKVEPCTCPLCS